MEKNILRIIPKTLHMKFLHTAAIAICTATSISSFGQDKLPEKTKTSTVTSKDKSPDDVFKKRNKDVRTVDWHRGKTIVITKADGSTEKYNIGNAAEKTKVETLYG